MKRVLWVFLALVALAIVSYAMMGDRLPPRTALKVARAVSRLRIPGDARVIVFRDEWTNLNGNGSTLIALQVSPAEMENLVVAAKARGFASLTTASLISEEIRRMLDPGTSGLARSRGDAANGSTVVLDTTQNRILVHFTIS